MIISIDGACRRNGKPDCIASGGIFVDHDKALYMKSTYEIQSTNQRGELLALMLALDTIWEAKQEAQIITDSEYLFNTMRKDWLIGWENRGWKTSSGSDVKNADLWQEIKIKYDTCINAGIEIVFYHIKGHCIPFGEVTAKTLLSHDTTGGKLLAEVMKKYDKCAVTSRVKQLEHANELSERNNGFKLSEDILKRFVVMNVMADIIATKCVDTADQLWSR